MKKLAPREDLVLRIIKISELWGFDAIIPEQITKAYTVLKPLITKP